MEWEALSYNGDLQEFIQRCRKTLLDVASVEIQIPDNILSYSILGKLCKDTHLFHLIDGLAMDKSAVENPNNTLMRLQSFVHHLKSKDCSKENPAPEATALNTSGNISYPEKTVYYCANGKHNPMVTSHKASKCWIEFPHLRPERKKPDNPKGASAQITIAAAYHMDGHKNLAIATCPNSSTAIIDCGATHHMFHNPDKFENLKSCAPWPVTTGDEQSQLLAEGRGDVTITIDEITHHLSDCLFVPKLKQNLIALLPLIKKSISINREGKIFQILDGKKTLLKGNIANRLMVVNFIVPKIPRAYLASAHSDIWHRRLGHPNY